MTFEEFRRYRRSHYVGRLVRKVERDLAAGKIEPGKVYVQAIHHDDWCALLARKGPCNCNPEIRTTELT